MYELQHSQETNLKANTHQIISDHIISQTSSNHVFFKYHSVTKSSLSQKNTNYSNLYIYKYPSPFCFLTCRIMNDVCLLFESLCLMGCFQIPSVPSAAHLSTLPRPVASSHVGVVAPGRSFLSRGRFWTGELAGWEPKNGRGDLWGIVWFLFYLFFRMVTWLS